MVVLEPLKVTLLGCDRTGPITVPDFPNEPERGSHAVQFAPTIYIEQSDFKRVGEKGYRRLCPGQSVGLRYAGFVISLEDVVEKNGQVILESW
jgi:glutaminyl-tRNA synthetase